MKNVIFKITSPFIIAWGRTPVCWKWRNPKNNMNAIKIALARHYYPGWHSKKYVLLSKIMYFWMLLAWPLRALIIASVGLGKYGERAKEISGISYLKQFRDQLEIAYLHDCNPEVYYLFELFNKKKLQEADYYLLNNSIFALVGSLNCYETDEAVEDKLNFSLYMEKFRLPLIPILSIIDNGQFTGIDGSPCELPVSDFIVKPRRGLQGQRIYRFELLTDGHYLSSDGTTYTQTSLQEHLRDASKAETLLVQPQPE